ncbi:MAG: xanthine dehydrogenase family protein molybdopterin-binding subunit [Gemmatimonadota bacterium]
MSSRYVTTQVEIEGRVETRVVEAPGSEPAPWGEEAELTIVGQSLPRVDGALKAAGAAVYTADVSQPGMLHAAIVRSPVARGRVDSIDFSAALAVPGVVDVTTAKDAGARPIRVGGLDLFSTSIMWAGQPLAAVCATSRASASRGAAAVRLVLEVEPPVLTVEQATAPDAPLVRPRGNLAGGEPTIMTRGDADRGLAEADVVITREFSTPSALHSAMEPHGAVAEWTGEMLTIRESTQGVFRVREEVARAFGLPQSRVRVIKEHMGGGFGAKNNAGAHTMVAALFARRTGRPVACIIDREGEQSDTGHRPASWQRVTLGATSDGRLVAIDVQGKVALGANGWEASIVAVYHEMYGCPNVRTQEWLTFVNQQQMQSFRAPGHVEGAFAFERSMDVLARRLAIDPLELRRLNFAAIDASKGRPWTANRLLECYEVGARRFGWSERELRRNDAGGNGMVAVDQTDDSNFENGGGPHRSPQERASNEPAQPQPRWRRGFGMAAQVWGAGGGPPAYATVRINADGSIDVLTGTQDLGTGSRTIMAQIAAEELGARFEDTRVTIGDTERTPYTGNSWGSMTTASVGPAVRNAAAQARERFLEAALAVLGSAATGARTVASTVIGTSGETLATFADVMRRLSRAVITGEGSRGPNPQNAGIMTFGAHFAQVKVDPDTGYVVVERIVAVHDAGRIINPMLAVSQLQGGIIQGLGFALTEERLVDQATGRTLNTSLHDYRIPTFADIPAIDASCLGAPDVSANHIGARGLAEPPIIPVAPAIANAVADALGVEVNSIPLTPARVLTAISSPVDAMEAAGRLPSPDPGFAGRA